MIRYLLIESLIRVGSVKRARRPAGRLPEGGAGLVQAFQNRLQGLATGIVVELPDPVDASGKGRFASQAGIHRQSRAQAEQVQALEALAVLVQRTAGGVGVQAAAQGAQGQRPAVLAAQLGHYGLVTHALDQQGGAVEQRLGAGELVGAAIQLQRPDLDRGAADALTGKDLATDLVGAVAQSAGTVDPLGKWGRCPGSGRSRSRRPGLRRRSRRTAGSASDGPGSARADHRGAGRMARLSRAEKALWEPPTTQIGPPSLRRAR